MKKKWSYPFVYIMGEADVSEYYPKTFFFFGNWGRQDILPFLRFAPKSPRSTPRRIASQWSQNCLAARVANITDFSAELQNSENDPYFPSTIWVILRKTAYFKYW